MRLLARARRNSPPTAARRAELERLLLAASDESRRLGHDHVGTEHLLLALTEDLDPAAGRALARLGVTRDAVRRDVERLVGACIDPRRRAIDPDALATLGIDLDEVTRRVEETFGPGALDRVRSRALDGTGAGCRCIAPRLKKALELAVGAAGDGPVGSGQILISLTAVEDCIAARILGEHGVTPDALRRAVEEAGA